MQKLNTIKLINWQSFYDNTIPVSGNILVTGENGAGKSSMLDALYFVLAGGSSKFNLAATDEASRSVETYMRGTIGVEGRECLRPGPNLISHVALEFADASGNSLILGCALEIRDAAPKADQSFYLIRGGHINDELYFVLDGDKKKAVNAKLLQERSSLLFGERSFIPVKGTKTEIKTQIARALGLASNKYYELLPKAIAFKPIREVNDFVFDFLLPEHNVDIASIRASIHSYMEIRKDVEIDEKKKEQLESIVNMNSDYEEKSLQKSLLQALNVRKNKISCEKKIASLQALIKTNTALVGDEIDKRSLLVSQIEDVQHKLFALSGQDWYKALEENQRAMDENQKAIDALMPNLSKFNRSILEESELARSLSLKGDFASFIKSEDFSGFQSALSTYDEAFESRRDALSDAMGLRWAQLNEAKQKQQGLQTKLDALRRGLPQYDYNATTLMKLIHRGFIEEEGHDIEVHPFCELIDIAPGEEGWRNAVEGYLNTRRFDLFVKEEYYDKALSIYERNKKEYHIHSIGLVNVAKLDDRQAKPNSLASKVVTDDPDAQRYVNYVLGDIVCVDSEQELKYYEASITRSVMVYRNKAARSTRPEIYATPYIGKSAYSAQLSSLSEELKKSTELVNELASNVSEVRAKLNRASDSKRKQLLDSPNYWRQYAELLKHSDALSIEKEKLELASKEGGHGSGENYAAEKAELERQRDESLTRQARLNADIDLAKRQISELEAQLKESQEELSSKINDPKVAEKLEEFAKKNSSLGPNEVNRQVLALNPQIASLERAIISAMATYINEFRFDSAASLENIGDFLSEHNKVVGRELGQFKKDLERAQAECATAFKENYIAQIRKHILDERANIRKLNKVLADKPFGNDGEVYQFVVARSKDPSFGPYYDIFTSKEDISSKDLFLDSLDSNDSVLMKDLFNRLTATPGDEKQEKLLRLYTDYRMFMNYDIQITNRRSEISFFSKISRGKSGGETQTPFYVIIAASFDQIVHEGSFDKEAGCIVILDEAFNKMDASRISATMSYFNDLSIQLIIGLPSNNAKILMPYVDTTIGIVKSRDRSYIRTDTRKADQADLSPQNA